MTKKFKLEKNYFERKSSAAIILRIALNILSGKFADKVTCKK